MIELVHNNLPWMVVGILALFVLFVLYRVSIPDSPAGSKSIKHNAPALAFIGGCLLTGIFSAFWNSAEGNRVRGALYTAAGYPSPTAPPPVKLAKARGPWEYELSNPGQGQWYVYHYGTAEVGIPVFGGVYQVPDLDRPNVEAVSFYIRSAAGQSKPVLFCAER